MAKTPVSKTDVDEGSSPSSPANIHNKDGYYGGYLRKRLLNQRNYMVHPLGKDCLPNSKPSTEKNTIQETDGNG